jgi:two-component system, OmpR family, sensor kinase
VLRSLRSKLLVWYSLALVTVTAVFAALLYFNLRGNLYAEADLVLDQYSAALRDSVRQESDQSFSVELAPELIERFGQEGDSSTYYAIWDAGGRLVDQSQPDLKTIRPKKAGVRTRAGNREHSIAGPAGSLVLVGQSMTPQNARLNQLLALIWSVGGLVLAVTLAAGWFLTGRALDPIERISTAAARVSASNLAARIDAADMETELGRLAATINETFDRLQRSFEQQTQFTADASHELRTPLATLMAQAELVLGRERNTEDYKQALVTIQRSARRMKAVVEGLLVLARADAAPLPIQKENVRLDQLIDESCKLLQPLAAASRVSVATQLQPVCASVDRERFAEVISNLLTNAIQYNREGGRVDVRLRETGEQSILEVADTGVGISPNDLPRVFDRFYRADKARSRSAGGSGLGLAIVKWIVDAHGGTITVQSETGVGTTFAVSLPRSDAC